MLKNSGVCKIMVKINKRIALRREQQLENLVLSAEKAVAIHGMAGFKARELAEEIGVSLGMIYNLVDDMDELILRVAAKTLDKLDKVLAPHADYNISTLQQAQSSQQAKDRLINIAHLYRAFASEHTNAWRALFEYQLPAQKPMPQSLTKQQEYLLSHIATPLKVLCPFLSDPELSLNVRMMFSAVHGVIILGLDKKMVAVPLDEMDQQLEKLVRIMCAGLENVS